METDPESSVKGWAVSEPYVPAVEDSTALVQEIYANGLIFLLNTNVLHHYGYALGVSVDDSNLVNGLVFYKSSDPDGVVFSEDLTVAGRQKLTDAGLR